MIEARPCGDAALQIRVTDSDYERRWRTTHRLAGWLREGRVRGIVCTVPTYDAVLVEFDTAVVGAAELILQIEQFPAAETFGFPPASPRTFLIPAAFGGDDGPDLDTVAGHLRRTPAQTVASLAERVVTIRCYSFAGSPMTDELLPGDFARRADPRLAVPQGSIAVAGRQAMMFSTIAPTGWNVIGRSPVALLDLETDPVAAYRPGDRIRFVPVTAAALEQYRDVKVVDLVAA